MQEQPGSSYPMNTGHHANLGEAEKKKRLSVMVQIWQGEIEKRVANEGYRSFLHPDRRPG
jgi:hypothetical protein